MLEALNAIDGAIGTINEFMVSTAAAVEEQSIVGLGRGGRVNTSLPVNSRKSQA